MSSVKPSSEGIQKVKLLMAEMIRPDKPDQKGWTQANLAERSGADLSTVKRFLKGESVKFDSLVWITGAVGLKPEDVIDAPLNETEANIVNWIAICGEMLAKQKEARQLRKEATAIGAEVNVYVPLDLLEHKEQTRSKQEKADSDQRNQYQERKVVKTYEHNDFLKSLTDRQSKNKHITIVGEAGAGKTTLLARIADELDKNQKLQIFVSLADLRERSLEDHIYGNWLSKALGVQKDSINAEQKNDLFQQFQSGEIWLLLDGLDEMRAKSSADALEKINREIKEVIGQSQVVLTSRLNVWDAYLNRLSGFDTFRMGDFSPEQVDKFISDWFIGAKKPESAPILQAKLKEPNRDRIRDMVRHPLRLALLCQAFYRDLNTELPETKAGLYELFVRYFYEWKPNIVDEDLTQDTLREELHLALGKLAIAGIDGDAGFRLSRSLAVKEMGDRLFKLASDVGWLTLIERDEQDQEVYAFYHASFQEYFAALAVQALDSEYFLPTECDSNNFDSIKPKKYRVFCQEWKDIILFWIGRMDIEKFMKKTLIYKLMLFQDNCGDFYRFRALCIATECLSEFSQIKHADLLISWITSYAFIYDLDKYTRYLYNNNYTEEVKSILKKTKVKELIINLEKRIFWYADRKENESSTNDFYLEDFELAKILFFVDPNNQLATNKIVDLLDNNKKYHFNTQDLEDIRQLYLLSPITFNNTPKFLIDILSKGKYKYITEEILRTLTSILNTENYHFLMSGILEIVRKKISDNNLEYLIETVEFLILSTNDQQSEVDMIDLIYTKFI
ncbi:MAG: NACHT domain-containing protein, partial [Pseudanabaena sp.]